MDVWSLTAPMVSVDNAYVIYSHKRTRPVFSKEVQRFISSFFLTFLAKMLCNFTVFLIHILENLRYKHCKKLLKPKGVSQLLRKTATQKSLIVHVQNATKYSILVVDK